MPAKITSSSNRSKRSTKKPVTQGQNPQRANRQGVSQAKVTSASNGKPTGSAAAKVTTGRGGMGKPLGRGVGPAAVAYETLKARPTAAGTVTAAQSGRAPSRFANARDLAMKKASAIKGSPVVGPRKSSSGSGSTSAAKQFDSAFAAARKAGKSTFTWKGKKYTTKMK
jgi:hypothetical protein